MTWSHHFATLPVADTHCNSFHGRAAVFENGTSVRFNTLVQDAAHGKAAAMMTAMVFSARSHSQQVGTGIHTLGGDLHKPSTLHDHTDRQGTAHASPCRPCSHSTKSAFRIATRYAPPDRTPTRFTRGFITRSRIPEHRRHGPSRSRNRAVTRYSSPSRTANFPKGPAHAASNQEARGGTS